MTEHTPGPWRYEEGTKTIRAVPTNYWLATMDSWDSAVDHAANARLIAAAPDLLAVLKQALSSRWLSIDHAHNRTPEACDIRKAMCEAIDRAEG